MNLQRQLSSAETGPLDRLTAVELQALTLLAEGHTVKSIAAQTGHSVGAINERLRQARRKTGASSSRELARVVKAQKVGDEKIGMASAADLDDSTAARRATTARRWKIGGIVMSAILIGGIAAMLSLGDPGSPESQAPAPSGRTFSPAMQAAPADEVLGPVVETSHPDPKALHAELRSEKRDETWAPRVEAALKAHFSKVPRVGGASNPVRVICGSTLCEVAGIIDADETTSSAEMDPTMRGLQSSDTHQATTALGLEHVITGFGQTRDRKPNYFSYLRRKGS